jgi:type VI protein secretion system component Hcp
MRALHLRWILPLAALAIVVGASVASGALRDNFTKPVTPLPGHGAVAHLTLTGSRQGELRGGGANGAINVVALDFILKRAFDAHTQLPTAGRPLCRGVSFRKPTDASTPALVQAESTNEVITRAVFRENGLTISLTNAVVAAVHHLAAAQSGQYEDVVLAPSRIEFEWTANGATAVHDCSGD